MKTTRSNSFYEEQITVAWNRAGQLLAELNELGTDLANLEVAEAALTERVRTFTPAPEKHGICTIDPNVDSSDPREPLAVLKARLRRMAEKLDEAADLLEQRQEKIRALVAD